MTIRSRTPIRAALLVAGLLLLAGCSRTLLTAPELDLAPALVAPGAATQVVAPPPPSRLLGPTIGSIPAADSLLNWVQVTQVLVPVGEAKQVAGHRYQLDFDKGSLPADELITIQDYDPNVIDVQFGPHGLKFGTPVTLSIDFSGTACDPGAARYDGSEPVLYWLNDRTNQWEEVPGRTDWTTMRHVVQLQHFSRYVLGGKAGWKQSPNRADDD